MQDFKRKNRGKDFSANECAIKSLRTQCERAFRTLSSSTQAFIVVDSLFEGIDYSCPLSRVRLIDPNLEVLGNFGLDERKVHTDWKSRPNAVKTRKWADVDLDSDVEDVDLELL